MQNKKTFYAIHKNEKLGWVRAFKEAIGYSNLYDYYNITVISKRLIFNFL